MATLLIVDDDIDFLHQMKLVLENAGYSIIAAENPAEARELLETASPDLAIVDLMMDTVDAGFKLCHSIKQQDASIPIIMVTGVSRETGMTFDASTKEERSWIKADTVLTKPVRFEQLKGEVEHLLKQRNEENVSSH